MIFVTTTYACNRCGADNRPHLKHCSTCGLEIPDWRDKPSFNVFSRLLGSDKPFNPVFGGDPILDLEDLKDAIAFNPVFSPKFESFIGMLPPWPELADGKTLTLLSWTPVLGDHVFGEDEGEKEIVITMLE